MIATDRRRGVRTLLPNILVKFSITVLVIWAIGTTFTYLEVKKHMTDLQNTAIQAMTEGTVAGLSDMIVTRDYTHLQETLRQSMDNKSIHSLVVTDTTGRVLSTMKRVNGVAEPNFDTAHLNVPNKTAKATIIEQKGYIVTIWQKIDSTHHVGWLQIEFYTNEYDNLISKLLATMAVTLVLMLAAMGIIVGYQFHIAYNQMNQYETSLLDAARTDPLTKLPNRMVLDSAILSNMARATMLKSSFAVVFMDLDGFKSINDTLGHAHGDKLLVEVALRLKRMLRDDDVIIRLGGDEFVLILSSVHGKDLDKLLTRIRDRINNPYNIDNYESTIGVSMGVAEYSFDNITPQKLITQADKAMYHAKESGKNSIVYYKDIK